MQAAGGREPAGPGEAAGEREVPTFLALPANFAGPLSLPGLPHDSFTSRLNKLRAPQGRAAVWLALITAALLIRSWHLATPLIRAWLASYSLGATGSIAWQELSPASATRWREVPAALLTLSSCGLGLGWIQMRNLLTLFAVHAGGDADVVAGLGSAGLALAVHVVALTLHVALLLFASGAVWMALVFLSMRMRLSLGAAVQAAVAITAWPFNDGICATAPLAHPAARAHTRHIYFVLSHLSYLLPLPVAPVTQPDDEAQCVTLLTFLQLSVGTLVPLLMHAVSEARLFQFHQRQRWQAGLPLLRGAQAAAYDSIWWGTLGGSGPHTCLAGGLLLVACWDWCAFLCVSATSQGAG